MAKAPKRKQRANAHDPEAYPLWTEDEVLQLQRRENLYKAATRWGGSIEAWARLTGVSEKTVRRWLENPGMMKAESVDRTCAAFDVSREYLKEGYVSYRGLTPSAYSEPTSAEKDRMDAETLTRAYEALDAADQRLVTSIVLALVDRKQTSEWYKSDTARYQSIIYSQMNGHIMSDEDFEWFRCEATDPDPLSIEESEWFKKEWLKVSEIALAGAKKRFEEQQERLKKQKGKVTQFLTDALDGEGKSS